VPSNADIAELLAIEAESATPPLDRAFKKASRAACLWEAEAADIVSAGRSVTELPAVGSYLEKLIVRWMEKPPRPRQVIEIRRDFLTWTEAQRILSKKMDWKQALRGDLQMHTLWSDGNGTVRDMAAAGLDRGYQYIAITDHAKSLRIAGGIDEAQLERQADEIAKVNLGFRGKNYRVLRSIELNLDLDGKGDLEPKALRKLDIVLGAFHSSLRKTEDQTHRYLAALSNPDLNILGHPKGRIYNFRHGLEADWARVFAMAAKTEKAVEIDSYPDRQDLSVPLLKLAKSEGCRISIGTDAHSPDQLRFIDLGLAAALRAKIPKDRILNFMDRDDLLAWAKMSRQ